LSADLTKLFVENFANWDTPMAFTHYSSKALALLAASLLLAACGGSDTTVPDPEPTDDIYGSSASEEDTQASDFEDFGRGEEIGFDPSSSELSTIIFFDFDSYEVRPDDADVVGRHSIQIMDSGASVRLEGHADERGSREYNIGLGERRAQAVRRMLMIQGVPAARISTVSFGEERPADLGNDEAAYAQNRRVVINYIN
jgi:peptidoglycan-associated lipoprotein